jgi:cellulose biosynthesis protein BcsQ
MEQTFGDMLLKTIIYRHIKLAEGPVHELPVSLYAGNSAAATEYRELAKELLDHGK